MPQYRSVLSSAVVASAITLGAMSAQAATCGGGIGDTENFTTSTDCALPPVGNGGNAGEGEMNAGAGVFGITSWDLLEEIATTNGADDIAGSVFSLVSNAGNTGGSWALKDGFSFDPNESYAFVLKGGNNGTIAYLMNTMFRSGSWKNDDLPLNNGGNVPGLSNIRLFGTGDLIETTTPVPLPAAVWMLLAGLAGLGALARRRAA